MHWYAMDGVFSSYWLDLSTFSSLKQLIVRNNNLNSQLLRGTLSTKAYIL